MFSKTKKAKVVDYMVRLGDYETNVSDSREFKKNCHFFHKLTQILQTFKFISEKKNITRESRCLAGEPKHFPFAIVFVLIIKITLTCKRGFPNGNGS